MDMDSVSQNNFHVDRVSNISLEHFEREYFNKGRPVVIENAIDDWPALKWTLQSIKEKAGHNTVFVRQNTAEESYKMGKKYNIESMQFSNYIENIEVGNKKSQNSYLAVQNIKKALPELVEDIRIPVYVQKLHCGPYLWIARQGHYEFCHFDPDDNILLIFSGKKEVKLYPAEDLQCLYPNPFGSKGKTIQSRVNCSDPDLEQFPNYALSKCYECELNAGDMLYFPAFWFHQITSPVVTISMNIFFGDKGSNPFLTKIMTSKQWPSFRYWLLNIVEQNRSTSQFQKVLQHLPYSVKNFLLKQWHEVPTDDQLDKLLQTILDYCGLAELPSAKDKVKHPPPLKIRGLLWRS